VAYKKTKKKEREEEKAIQKDIYLLLLQKN
jgi:hypothetical protein